MIATVLSVLSLLGALGAFLHVHRELDSLDTALGANGGAHPVDSQILQRLDGHDRADEKLAKHLDAIVDRVNEHDGRFGELTLAVDEGIKHVDRSERRVRSTVRRAVQRMEEAGYIDEAVEAEAAGIRELDAEERGEEGLQPVPAHVESDPAADFSDLPGEWP